MIKIEIIDNNRELDITNIKKYLSEQTKSKISFRNSSLKSSSFFVEFDRDFNFSGNNYSNHVKTDSKEMPKHKNKIFIVNNLLKNADSYIGSKFDNNFYLINKDLNPGFIKLKGSNSIFYGLSGDSDITASSIAESRIQYCVQNSFKTFENEDIEQQEFPVNTVTKTNTDIYEVLVATTIALICG